jgi:hypothetical protein
MKKYTYKRKDNGKLVQSDTPLKDKNLKLVTQIRDGKMKAAEVNQKRK